GEDAGLEGGQGMLARARSLRVNRDFDRVAAPVALDVVRRDVGNHRVVDHFDGDVQELIVIGDAEAACQVFRAGRCAFPQVVERNVVAGLAFVLAQIAVDLRRRGSARYAQRGYDLNRSRVAQLIVAITGGYRDRELALFHVCGDAGRH